MSETEPVTTATFDGLRVAAFESRRATEMARLIERLGGVPHVSPSMREVPLESHSSAVDFAQRLFAGQIDVVILLTGVGTRQLVAQVERHFDRQRFLDALCDVTTIARGPKPILALKEIGLVPTWKAPEPNTWREVLKTVDERVPVANLTVAVQEYGLPNASLVAGLEARGATVLPVTVYHYDFPTDVGPLTQNIHALTGGRLDVALFTSAHQIVNLLRLSHQLGVSDALRQAMTRVVVASIGPTTSETLRECELPVDLEPEHSKMGQLVVAAASGAHEVLSRKRPRVEVRSVTNVNAESATPSESLFLKACRREVVQRTPIWLMRQAGRYMPEYRRVRSRGTFLELCKNPELCAEVMLTAVGRLGVDAAIIFADLLPILEPMGLALSFSDGEGPSIGNPVREPADVDRVRELEDVSSLDFVARTVRLTRAGLPPSIPVIGFAGAPFTLASYVIEGAASRNYLHVKAFMYRDPAAWHELMSRLARSIVRYLNAQIDAGAAAVQIFDSWVGCLSVRDYRQFVLPHVQSVVAGVRAGVPVISFATGNPALVPLLAEAGPAVVGVDWRTPLDQAWAAIGCDRAIQGNLDPAVLLGSLEEVHRQAGEVLSQAAGRPGHIFNLGHGIHPQTPVENVIELVQFVRELSSR